MSEDSASKHYKLGITKTPKKKSISLDYFMRDISNEEEPEVNINHHEFSKKLNASSKRR